MIRSAVILLLSLGVVWSGEPTAEALVQAITIRASGLSMTRSASYDQQGALNSNDARFRLMLRLMSGQVPVTSIGEIRLDDIVTDSGETLTQIAKGESPSRISSRSSSHGTTLTCALSWPTKPVNTIQELRGTVRVNVASGKLKKVTLDRIADYEQKNAVLEGFPGSSVKIQRQKEQAQVILSQDLEPLITELRLLDKDGAPLSSEPHGSGRGSRTFRGTFPDDAKLVILLYETQREVLVPISLKDLAFPAPAPVDGKKVLRSEDAEAGGP